MDDARARKLRKEEGKRQKRRKIEESGGIRPRSAPEAKPGKKATSGPTKSSSSSPASRPRPSPPARTTDGGDDEAPRNNNDRTNKRRKEHALSVSSHRFGKVMETVPCVNKPRRFTVSVAVPGSIVANCQTREQKTQLAGQIARAATIYHVDEIIVYDDKLAPKRRVSDDRHNDHRADDAAVVGTIQNNNDDSESERKRFSEPNAFLARVLQFCECPQYLRRAFFPMHPDLQFAGLLAPIDAPHHVRADDHCPYREGIVLDKKTTARGSLVNCGIRGRPVVIEQRLQPGLRCTVKIESAAYKKPGPLHGQVVSPRAQTETDGTYWGYTVRLASSLQAVWDECPFDDTQTYDLKIGTSERGNESVDTVSGRAFKLPPYRHALIVLGGVAGLEECVDADESLLIGGNLTHTLFDKWVNICPYQGSRTIRTEEAILITLAKLSPQLWAAGSNDDATSNTGRNNNDVGMDVALNNRDDENLSDESSSGDDEEE